MVQFNNSHSGILSQLAPRWGVDQWLNLPEGKEHLEIDDYANKVIYLYNFQSWCPGCHSHGFPTLKAVKDSFKNTDDVAFLAVQTVFEGFEANTLERAKETAEKFQLDIPFGHDPGANNQGSNIMRNYKSGGTPWTTIIDKEGIVRFNGFQGDVQQLTSLIDTLRNNVSEQD